MALSPLALHIRTHPLEPRLPPVADRLDPRRDVLQGLRDHDEANLAAIALAPHQPRALERAEVLHHGLPRDGKIAGERGRASGTAAGEHREKVAAAPVRESGERIIGHVQPYGCTS